METRERIWQQMIAEWLELKRARSASRHTYRSYAAVIELWQTFLASRRPPAALWEANASHVRQWQQSLRARRLAESSVNHHLSCVSSFYTFVRGEQQATQGAEQVPHAGSPKRGQRNPFLAHNVERGRTQTYERARVLSQGEVGQLLCWLEERAGTVAGARNHALLLTFLYTGWRSRELLRMRWGDLRPSQSKPGAMIYAWRGKGNRRADDLLPAVCFESICRYLRLAGRLSRDRQPARDEAVWLPVRMPQVEQLRNAPQVVTGRPVTAQSALRILRTALRSAGVRNGEAYRITDLRHTHARVLLEGGQSLAVVQKRLHHKSPATTEIYIRAVHAQEPADVASEAFARLLR